MPNGAVAVGGAGHLGRRTSYPEGFRQDTVARIANLFRYKLLLGLDGWWSKLTGAAISARRRRDRFVALQAPPQSWRCRPVISWPQCLGTRASVPGRILCEARPDGHSPTRLVDEIARLALGAVRYPLALVRSPCRSSTAGATRCGSARGKRPSSTFGWKSLDATVRPGSWYGPAAC